MLQSAGLLFFAFAGYARIATLGEEVRDPRRTIPRAVVVAFAIALAVHAAVLLAALHALGAGGVAASDAPLADAATAGGWAWAGPVVRAGAALAAVGALLGLVAGVRTAIGWSSTGVLTYYLIANLASLTQPRPERRFPRWLAVVGALGCVALVAALPPASVLTGLGVMAAGLGGRWLARRAGREV